MSSMSMAYRSLNRRRARTALTVSGIVIGVAMILVLLSLAAGTANQTNSLIRGITGADITVVNSTSTQATTTGRFGATPDLRAIFGDTNTLNQSLSTKISGVSGVYAVSPELAATGFLNKTHTIFIFGIDPSSYSNVTGGLTIVSGTFLSSNNQIVVGNALAQRLSLNTGSIVSLSANSTSAESNYTIVGIYSSSVPFLERGAYVTLSSAQNLTDNQGKVSDFFVKADSPNEINSVASSITDEISGVSTITPSTVVASASNLSNVLSSFFTLIGLVALLAGAFGVINTMMMSISEQTREIGTLRAIGAQKNQVLKMFLSESLLIGLIGGVAGVLIGSIVTLIIPAITGAGRVGILRGALSPIITPYDFFLSLGLGILVGAIAGIYPAWRASKMDPVEALRHV